MGTDTREMVLIHRFIRRELRLLPELIMTAPARDIGRARLIARHGLDLLDTIRIHSAGPVRELLGRWAADASLDAAVEVAHAVQKLARAVLAHLDEEEEAILPLAAVHLSRAERGRLGEHGIARTPPGRRLRILGQILEEASDAERERFLSAMPAPPRILWAAVGRWRYASYVRKIRAGLLN